MFTYCPKCALTLAVTAADLRAGQGYVRCGRCSNVFNALLALSEESDTLEELDAPPPGTATPDGAADELVDPDQTGERAAPEMLVDPVPGTGVRPPSEPQPPAVPLPLRLVDSPPRPPLPALTDTTEVEEFRGTGTYETIVLEGDTFLQTEEMVAEEAFDSRIAAVTQQLADAQEESDRIAHEAEATPDAEPMPEPAPAAAGSTEATGSTEADAAAMEQLRPPPARPAWQPLAAAAALALLLLAQYVHHGRNDLATHASLNGPLTRLYAALGKPLSPNWDLAAYDVRQLGADADATDSHLIHVRLSLANRGAAPQALPLVRLTLIDRYGKPLSSGELAPAEYLPEALRGQRLLDPDQHIDTEVKALDPDDAASSFELDVCMPAAGGGLRCAGDAAASGARP